MSEYIDAKYKLSNMNSELKKEIKINKNIKTKLSELIDLSKDNEIPQKVHFHERIEIIKGFFHAENYQIVYSELKRLIKDIQKTKGELNANNN